MGTVTTGGVDGFIVTPSLLKSVFNSTGVTVARVHLHTVSAFAT